MALPDLNLLIALDALLEEGSVVGAARRLHLSPPAMSRTLARIRETVGDPVFVQAGRRLVPTPRALALREQVRATVEQALHVLGPGSEVDLSTLDKRFNVRANDIFVGVHGGALLEAFAHEMPRAMLCVAPEHDDVDVEALRSGRVDLLISASRTLGPEIRVQPLFTARFTGLARIGHPLFDGPVSAERFAQWGHIGVSRRGKSAGPIDDGLARLGLARHVALVVPTPYTALFALLSSDLLLALPRQLVDSAVQSGLPVRSFEVPVPLSPVSIMQAWHPRFQDDPAHRWLRQTIHRLASEAPQTADEPSASRAG